MIYRRTQRFKESYRNLPAAIQAKVKKHFSYSRLTPDTPEGSPLVATCAIVTCDSSEPIFMGTEDSESAIESCTRQFVLQLALAAIAASCYMISCTPIAIPSLLGRGYTRPDDVFDQIVLPTGRLVAVIILSTLIFYLGGGFRMIAGRVKWWRD